MDLSDIPTFLGGDCNCPSGCISNIPNSQKFCVSGITDGMMEVVVGARGYESLKLPLSPGMKITWRIKVESKKIEVSLLFKPKRSSGNEDQVLVEKEILGDEKEISGEFNATQEGTAVLLFDNKNSFFTSKKVLYKIDLE